MPRVLKSQATDRPPYPAIDAPCAYFGTCGGCSLQDIAYADQLDFKLRKVRSALGEAGVEVAPSIVPLEDPWRYRHKAELSFGFSEEGLSLGYHRKKSFVSVVDIDDCLLMPEPAAALIATVREAAAATGLPAHHPRTHQGFFRHLIVRAGAKDASLMACLVTQDGPRQTVEAIGEVLFSRHPQVKSFYWGVNNKPADVAYPDTLELIRGEAFLSERVGPYDLLLHPFSFLQASTVQADRLYRSVQAWLGSARGGVAWDLYCGLGLIGFYLSGSFAKIYGIDVEGGFIELARRNAALNGISNIEYRTGTAEALLADRRFWLQEAKPDAVVLDPPRAGLHASVIAAVLGAKPAKIAYVSCNLQAMERDLKALTQEFPRYRVREVQAFDMFPQTPHVEALVCLERR